jgi:hypothetical protein
LILSFSSIEAEASENGSDTVYYRKPEKGFSSTVKRSCLKFLKESIAFRGDI